MNKILYFLIFVSFQAGAQTSALNLADSLSKVGERNKAILLLQKEEPKSDNILLKLARLQQDEGKIEEALANYEHVLENDSTRLLTAMDYGELLIENNNLNKADILFQKLTSKYPDNAAFRYRLGLVKEKQKDSSYMDHFFQTVGLDSTHQAALYKTAKYQLIHHNEFNAIHLAQTGLRYRPNNTSLLSILAQAYSASIQFEKAVPVYEKLVDLGENTEFVLRQLARGYKMTKQYDEAIEIYQELLEIEPGNSSYYTQIGSIYYGLEEFKNAEFSYFMALKLKDQPLDRELMSLGYVYKKLGNPKKSFPFFNKAIEENPQNERAYLERAIAADGYFQDKQSILDQYLSYLNTFETRGNPKNLEIARFRVSELRKEIHQSQ